MSKYNFQEFVPLNKETKERLIKKRKRLNQITDEIIEAKFKLFAIWERWYTDECDFDTFITQDRSPLHALYYEADIITSNPLMQEFANLKTPR